MMRNRYIMIMSVIVAVAVGTASYLALKGVKRDVLAGKEFDSLKKILRDSPQDIEAKHRLGLLYLYQGDYKAAEAEFLGILNIDPYNAKALRSIGMAYYRNNEPHKAATYWRTLLEVEPGNQFIWDLVNRIGANGSSAAKNAAAPHGNGSAAVSPEWQRHYQLGQESYNKRDFRDAIGHFKKAAGIKPDDFRTYFNIGASYYEMKELKEALESWQTAIKYKKDDLLTMKLISLAEEGLSRRQDTEEVKRMLRKEPANAGLHKALADIYAKDRDTAREAEKEYKETLRLEPANVPAYSALIDLYMGMDEYDKAVSSARRLVKAAPGYSQGKKKLDSLLAYNVLRKKAAGDWKRNGIAPYNEMLRIPGAQGAPFHIDKYEVTNARYEAFLKAAGYTPPARWSLTGAKGKENYPVTGVSWYDAAVYCKWDGKRLPTEEEWIRAGWSGSTTNYPWGDGMDAAMANTAESGFDRPVPVGSYPPQNGLYDMVGNVMEWTATEKVDDSTGEAGRLAGGAGRHDGEIYRIRKGGAFSSEGQHSHGDSKTVVSFLTRWSAPPTQRDSLTGFRCVKSEDRKTAGN